MEIDREAVYQVALASMAILAFVAAAMWISSAYGTNGHLTAQGGRYLVAAIVGFVGLMLGAGVWLERQEF